MSWLNLLEQNGASALEVLEEAYLQSSKCLNHARISVVMDESGKISYHFLLPQAGLEIKHVELATFYRLTELAMTTQKAKESANRELRKAKQKLAVIDADGDWAAEELWKAKQEFGF